MWMRILVIFSFLLTNTGCVKDEEIGELDQLRMNLKTDLFSISYQINEKDQVFEYIIYDPDYFTPLDEVTLASRQYYVQGAYARLTATGGWASSVRSAPTKAEEYSGARYIEALRQMYPLPTLNLWISEAPSSSGRLTTARIPIPTADDPRNGLDRSWASERAWMGKMVGQFLDVVGPPKLNPEDYVNRIPEQDRDRLPLKLNFSDYR